MLIPKFLRRLVAQARENSKPELLTWPQDPTVNEDGHELWKSTCGRYLVKREGGRVWAFTEGIQIRHDCKGVVSAMMACSKHLAKLLKQKSIPEVTVEDIRQETERVTRTPSRHRRSYNGCDKFGSRIGTYRANVNKCLSEKPKTMQELANEAGLKNTYFRKHMESLVRAGHVEKTSRGYKLKTKE